MAVNDVGAFWKKKSKKGENFLSGRLRISVELLEKMASDNGVECYVSLMKNKKKEGNQPDFRLYYFDND